MSKKEKAVVSKGYRGVTITKFSPIQRRILVGIPMTGLLRSEWVMARYGQVIPCNWSQMEYIQWVDQYSPIKFMVADARNIIVTEFIEKEFEWLIFIDHDVVLPPFFLVAVNERIIHNKVPVWGGLYFTKSIPSSPLIYRGRGNGYFAKWKLGDEVWCDGMGLGCHVIHSSVLKILWDESEEYSVAGRVVRRVFETPVKIAIDPESHSYQTQVGTEDLPWYSRIINDKVLERAGWKAVARRKYPFLCDTTLMCKHIDWDGIQYPARGEHLGYK